jgi:penicillin-binding protein 2
MYTSIVKSSNVYYYSLANEMGVDAMHDFMKPLGFGQITGIDVHGEVRGLLPSTTWKREAYKRPEMKKWYPGETVSLGIGQGYNNFTMLQLAVAQATLANGGTKYRPHLVKAVKDTVTGEVTELVQPPGESLGYQRKHVDLVRNALVAVNKGGTGTRVFAGAPYTSAGKTGTAQAVAWGQNTKYNAKALEEHQRDHSLFAAFAPAEAPKIAIAVIVENAGFGAAAAAPIVRRAFDYWLADQYPNEQDLAAVQVGKAIAPMGKPRVASEMPWPPVVSGAATAP